MFSIGSRRRNCSASTQSHATEPRAFPRLGATMKHRIALLVVPFAAIAVGGLIIRSGGGSLVANAVEANETNFLADPPMSNADRLALGVKQFDRGQYEEAVATLQQVQADMLGPKDQKKLSDTLGKAQAASQERKNARAEFEQGEEALRNNQSAAAMTHYKNAANNAFADEGTRQKALEQMKLADAMARKAGKEMQETYAAAVADFNAQRYDQAKAKFEQLRANGYRAGLFEKSPGDYLKEIDDKLAKAAPAPAAAPEQPAVTPPAPEATAAAQPAPTAAETPKKDPADAYHHGVDQFNKGDWIGARENFTIARDGGYKPGFGERAPDNYISEIDAKAAADDAKHQQELASQNPQTAQPAPEPAAEPAATPAASEPVPTDPAPAIAQTPSATEPAGAAPSVAAAVTPADTTAPEATPATDDASERIRRQAKAQELIAQAENARSQSRTDEALALYEQAAELDPSNTAARSGRDELAQAGRAAPTGGDSALARQEADVNAKRQYIRNQFDTAIAGATKAARAGQFDEADRNINAAAVARNQDPSIFTPEELGKMDTTLSTARQSLARIREDARAVELSRAQADATERLRQKFTAEEEQRRRTVADLIKTARQYVEQGKYSEALGVVDQILVIDPRNDYAIGVRPLIEDKALFLEQRKYREQFDRNFTEQLNEIEEKKIPYNDILRYPENWPDLSETREKSVAAERGEITADIQTAAQLERVLPEINFAAVPFSDVVDFLRDITQSNIFVNWKALEAAGIDRSTAVTARLRNVKFSKALNTILSEVSGGAVKLAYTIDEGVISISTEEDLAKNVVTRVYDIRDLIINVPDFTDSPDFNLDTGGGGGGRGGGGGGGGNIFGGGGGQGQNDQGPGRQELVDQIIRLIEDTVSTDSWKDNGGAVGSIRELGGQLIVTQTPENQRSLVRLLEQLRETRAIQVTIETRFLFVQRNFIEDVGVDVDFLFGRNGVAGNIPGPISVQNTTSDFTSAARLDTTLPGNLGGANFLGAALSTGVTFLDDWSVSVLLRATQAQVNTTQLTAPRVTLFNGQRAYVLVATQRAYVSDLNPIVGSGAVGFDPVISVVQTGVLLDVQATVSSDRKYVTLTLRPTLSRLISLTTFTIGGNIAFGNDSTTVPIAQSGQIQQPELQVTRVNTTVSVPDGGTLLLGGQTLAGEIEREEGVPILSKIPFLKRIFTNRSTAKDDQVLLILVKPTIIIQREREQEQFPLISVKTGGG